MARSGLPARVVIDQCRFDARYRGQLRPGRLETQQVEPADISEGDTVPGFDAAVGFRQSGMLRYRPTRVAVRVQAGDEMGDGISMSSHSSAPDIAAHSASAVTSGRSKSVQPSTFGCGTSRNRSISSPALYLRSSRTGPGQQNRKTKQLRASVRFLTERFALRRDTDVTGGKVKHLPSVR